MKGGWTAICASVNHLKNPTDWNEVRSQKKDTRMKGMKRGGGLNERYLKERTNDLAEEN